MKDKYVEIKKYWDDIFHSSPVNFDFIKSGIPIKEIENSIVWVSRSTGKLLDFGCGNGTLLLRAIYLSGSKGMGLDISHIAIKRAQEASRELKLSRLVDFIPDSIKYLEILEKNSFGGVILSNVLDNLLPSDGLTLLESIKQKLRKGGRFFLKLNDYKERQQMIDDGAIEIMDNVFQESEGLYLWNLDNETIRSIFEPDYQLETVKSIELMGTINRTFHMIRQ